MEKRVVAAIALAIAVLLAFRYLEERRLAELAKQRPPIPQQAPASRPAVAPPAAAASPPKPAPPMPLPAEERVPERTVVIEGDLYRAVLDNHGGVLTGWQLKKYKAANGDIFDMVATTHMEQRQYPASLILDDPTLTALANEENYSVEVGDGGSADTTLRPPATVVMRLRRSDLVIEKRFHFEPANYLVDFSATCQRGNQFLKGRIFLAQDIGPEEEHLLNRSIQLQAVAYLNGKVQRYSAPKDENQVQTVTGEVFWVGLDMQYFAEIAIPSPPAAAFEIQRKPVKAVDLGGHELARDLIRLTIPADPSADCRIYLGPKLQSQLAAVPGVDLSGVIDYGWSSFLVTPLLAGLKFIDQYTRNYGFAIILLTFAITLALFPLRLRQMVSMKKMQVLQPKIKEIQEKYRRYKKTDPKRAEMNQEIMAVYREHKVNPLGGCLPLLLQMPLLWAFYRLLANSIELRQAPFVGWIHDLSAKDPYFVLPIAMGITMLISQKMTPMAPGADPTQAKMMLIMPFIFTYMFLWLSAGLNLYFLCSNVFQIAFQKIAERWVGDKRSGRKSKG
jgi:YidC/Oxa1 family membrane protein insertase